jgi:phosphoribosyl 1,2-cyclic phosphodiesterase/DNA-binding NarL/FixJ family response regulator
MDTPAPSKGLVLIAEDVKVIRFKMLTGLREAGYEVIVAEDGPQCLDQARLHKPELILLDIMMPNMHGVEVMKRLRAETTTRDLGVIVCTAKSFEVDQSEMAALGAYGFLDKPFDMPDMVKIVDEFFAQRKVSPAHQWQARQATGESFAIALEQGLARLTLWGTRGSTPTPGASFLRHGGQTSCMSITWGEDTCIFDAGSGIRDLGLELKKGTNRNIHLFITHTHWDHIQGFPFFIPAYDPSFTITVYGARGFGKDLKSLFSGQLDHDYFPVRMESMKAKLNFVHLGADPIDINGLKIRWEFVNHPGATVGYRIDVAGKQIAWVPDHEFMEGYIGSPEGLTREHEGVAPYSKAIEFISEVDVLFHEAQYTNEEYPSRIGFGHSCLSNACLLVKLAQPKRWIVTHHDPGHDDRFLQVKLSLTRQLLARLGSSTEVEHGFDGLIEYL